MEFAIIKSKNMSDTLKKLNRIATTDTTWKKTAEFERENWYWKRHAKGVAVRILSALRAKNMKQKDLAALLDVSPQQVSKILKGDENLTLKTIAKIEQVLDIQLITNPEKTHGFSEVTVIHRYIPGTKHETIETVNDFEIAS